MKKYRHLKMYSLGNERKRRSKYSAIKFVAVTLFVVTTCMMYPYLIVKPIGPVFNVECS